MVRRERVAEHRSALGVAVNRLGAEEQALLDRQEHLAAVHLDLVRALDAAVVVELPPLDRLRRSRPPLAPADLAVVVVRISARVRVVAVAQLVDDFDISEPKDNNGAHYFRKRIVET